MIASMLRFIMTMERNLQTTDDRRALRCRAQ
jgi:hypothetical protein